jgi:hypothetical protein
VKENVNLKQKVSEKFRSSKQTWDENPANHGNGEIPPPPVKKSCLDRTKNGIARVAAQIRTDHWRSAVFLKRIKKRRDDRCWFCRGDRTMTRSHVLLNCPADKISARGSLGGKRPGVD